jgi:hypothetical protein
VIPRLASKLRGEACFRVDTLAELESPRLAGWHGWSLLAELTDPDTAVRAGVFRRTFPLQAVGFALIHNRPDDEIKRAIAQAERDLQTSATQTADVPAAEPAAGGTRARLRNWTSVSSTGQMSQATSKPGDVLVEATGITHKWNFLRSRLCQVTNRRQRADSIIVTGRQHVSRG